MATRPQRHPFTKDGTVIAMDEAPGQRPKIDPSDLATLPVHIQYMAAELHSIRNDVRSLNENGAAILQELARMPSVYATSGTVGELTKRVDTLESFRDRETAQAEQRMSDHRQLLIDVRDLRTAADRIAGGQVWLWTAWLVITSVLTLAIALKGKVW